MEIVRHIYAVGKNNVFPDCHMLACDHMHSVPDVSVIPDIYLRVIACGTILLYDIYPPPGHYGTAVAKANFAQIIAVKGRMDDTAFADCREATLQKKPIYETSLLS
jgi:hypothetical protein